MLRILKLRCFPTLRSARSGGSKCYSDGIPENFSPPANAVSARTQVRWARSNRYPHSTDGNHFALNDAL